MYVIVKYQSELFPDGKASKRDSIFGTYTANKCLIKTIEYQTKEAAEKDIKILNLYNPSVGYGICEVSE